jgi:DNA-binding XRE family transcriptional regulator
LTIYFQYAILENEISKKSLSQFFSTFMGYICMAMREQTTPLEHLRRQLEPRISQETMARKSGIVLQTYRNAESGKDILLSHAFSILEALNGERETRGLAPVSFEHLWQGQRSEAMQEVNRDAISRETHHRLQ